MKTYGGESNWIHARAVDVGSFGEGVKRYAEQFREEMDRRRLRYNHIEWP
jgi:hypothetical protein